MVRIFLAFFRIRTEYGEIQRISLYSVRMQENAGKMQTRITPNPDSFYDVNTARKMKFSIKGFVSKCYQIRKKTADLVTFTKETLTGRPHFLCSETFPYKKVKGFFVFVSLFLCFSKFFMFLFFSAFLLSFAMQSMF